MCTLQCPLSTLCRQQYTDHTVSFVHSRWHTGLCRPPYMYSVQTVQSEHCAVCSVRCCKLLICEHYVNRVQTADVNILWTLCKLLICKYCANCFCKNCEHCANCLYVNTVNTAQTAHMWTLWTECDAIELADRLLWSQAQSPKSCHECVMMTTLMVMMMIGGNECGFGDDFHLYSISLKPWHLI